MMSEQVQYRHLGKTGLRVSVPILGCMSFGSSKWLPWILDEDKGLEILKAAWDAGITTLDTADAYSNGESERITGNFILQNNIPRENLVIMTKVGMIVAKDLGTFPGPMPSFADTRDYVNNSGLSRAAIFNRVEASLARLNTSYIDVLQIHVTDKATPFEETMKALHDLVTMGKVRYIGACNLRAWIFAEMNHVAELNGWTKFSVIQVEHSPLYRNEELEMIDYCNFKGIGVIAYSPLASGYTARPIEAAKTMRSERLKGSIFDKAPVPGQEEIIRRIEKTAKEKGWTMAQVSLAWSVTKVTSPIVGPSSVAQLNGCNINGKSLTDEEVKFFEETYEHPPRRLYL